MQFKLRDSKGERTEAINIIVYKKMNYIKGFTSLASHLKKYDYYRNHYITLGQIKLLSITQAPSDTRYQTNDNFCPHQKCI